jgi:hypothetical protein
MSFVNLTLNPHFLNWEDAPANKTAWRQPQ